jgi:hypothetical protein
MATIVTRAGKGTPLTNNEVDANFTNLNNDKLEVEVNDLTTSVTWDNVPDAYITASSVTQHETALTITESQISDLQNYLTSYTETNDLSTAVTWDNVPDQYITESSVTQHESALTITESQISNLQSYLTSETSHADVLVDGDFSSAGFMKTNGNGGYSVDATTYLSNEIKDEDDMSSNSATALATQQSIKAYVDAHTSPEVNDLTSSVTWANVPDANITQSSVTQHQGALSITESQISDLQTYLTAEANDLSTAVTWANVPNANITESSVTQHQSALSITESQISDLGTYLSNEVKDEDDMASDSDTALATQQSIKAYVDSQVSSGGGAEVNDLSTTVTWANVPDANITESSVTQHQAALSITESQISDLQSYLTTHQDISGKANLSGAVFTGHVQVGDLFTPKNFTAYGQSNFYQGVGVVGNITATGTIDGRDVATDGSKLDGIEANADVTDTANVTSAGAAMLASSPTFTGTITAPNVDISTTGTVTTNIATGNHDGSASTKTVNIGTGFSGFFAGMTTVNIGTQSTVNLNTVNIGSGASTGYEDTINLKGNVTVDGTANINKYVEFKSDASGTGTYDQLVSFKAKSGTTTWAEAGRVAVKGLTSAPANFVIGMDKAALKYFDGFGSRNIVPADTDTANGTDAICDLGTYYNRFRIGKFSSGTSTTSDGREKRNIEELNEAELRVATRCKSLLRKYQRTEALELKGDDARLHFGIIAQDLEQAFADEGLDAHRYAMFLEDTWYVTEDGETFPVLEAVPEELRESAVQKSLKGIRYEQLLAFIIASI